MMAMLMVVGMSVISTGAADTAADYTEAAQQLGAIGIMKGDENGNLMLDQGVTVIRLLCSSFSLSPAKPTPLFGTQIRAPSLRTYRNMVRQSIIWPGSA